MDFRRIPRGNRKECFRFLENALDRAYHNNVQIFRKWYFRFLPSKPEVIVPVLCNIEWINANFPKTNFSWENLLVQCLLRCAVGAILCWTSGLGEAQQVFLNSDLKNQIQKLWVGTNLPCLLQQCTWDFLEIKMTASFKSNLKTDGLGYKMIFKFWKYTKRLHSGRPIKQSQ